MGTSTLARIDRDARDDEDPDLGFIDSLIAADERRRDEGDQAHAPVPGRDNPAPDNPAPVDPDPVHDEPPEDEAEKDARKPGRG